MVAIVQDAPRDPLAFDFGLNFKSSAERVTEERDHRLLAAERALQYYHSFLDDALRCIFPNDLILLGALTGAGKTELARWIAASNARAGKRVHYLALEAEPFEIERRTKFAVLAGLVGRAGVKVPGGFNYPDWYCGRLEPYVKHLDEEADRIVAHDFQTLSTFYRGSDFGHDDIKRLFLAIKDQTDLIVLDHLHYVDVDDENENRGFKRTMKMIRDVSLGIGRPVLLVAHIRKLDKRYKTLVPSIDDVHGSSDIAKICTRAILVAPSSKQSLEGSSCALTGAGTFFAIPKDRVGGALQPIALCDFDTRLRKYGETYTLGYQSRSGDKFEPMAFDAPAWARSHRAPANETAPHWQDGAS